MKYLKKILTIISFTALIFPTVIHALDAGTSNVGLDPIVIPFFPVFGTINSKSYTVISWITFIGGVLIILVVIFWILRILLAGLEAIRSEGDQEKLQEAFKKLQSNLVGVGVTFLIPIILTVIGFVLGIGSIFNWPKMFSDCPGSHPQYDSSGNRVSGYDYYFQAYFSAKPGEDSTQVADATCGLSSVN